MLCCRLINLPRLSVENPLMQNREISAHMYDVIESTAQLDFVGEKITRESRNSFSLICYENRNL